MDALAVIVVAGLATVAVTALAPKVRVASPLLLVLLGLGFAAWLHEPVHVAPEVLLTAILPPLLYSAAITVPTTELRRDLSTVSVFSVVLVALSSVVVGGVVAALVPGVGLPLGIALGAALSPTDAVATSIVRKAGASPRIVTVLEGESLLNDASALVLLRAAVAAIAGSFSFGEVAGKFVWAVAVAVVVGWLVGKANLLVRARLGQASLGMAVSLAAPYVAFLPTEHLGGSGLVAAVVAGLVTGHGAHARLRPADRLTEGAVWGTLELLLESAVFLLMGLQLPALVADAEAGGVRTAAWVGAVAAAVIVVVRAAVVAPALWRLDRRARRSDAVRERIGQFQERLADPDHALDARIGRPDGRGRLRGDDGRGRGRGSGRAGEDGGGDGRGRRGPARPARQDGPPERAEARRRRIDLMLRRQVADLDYLAAQAFRPVDGVVLVWAGMRGAVTLAAAQSLPADVPHRSLLVLIAFVVAAGTLAVQGGTLPWLLRRLGLTGTDPDVARLERADLDAALRTALAGRLDGLRREDGTPFPAEDLELARGIVERAPEPDRMSDRRALRLAIVRLQRAELLRLRDLGEYSSAALDAAFAQLDADELGLELREG